MGRKRFGSRESYPAIRAYRERPVLHSCVKFLRKKQDTVLASLVNQLCHFGWTNTSGFVRSVTVGGAKHLGRKKGLARVRAARAKTLSDLMDYAAFLFAS